ICFGCSNSRTNATALASCRVADGTEAMADSRSEDGDMDDSPPQNYHALDAPAIQYNCGASDPSHVALSGNESDYLPSPQAGRSGAAGDGMGRVLRAIRAGDHGLCAPAGRAAA